MLSIYLTPAILIYVLFVTFLLGAATGSFAECMAGRIAAGQNFIRGRSHCDSCGHVLSVKDLVPIFSWLFLKGRCRFCGAKISARCVWSELVCAAAFIGVVLRFDFSLLTLQYLILTTLLLAIALVDYDTGLIPNGLLLAIGVDWLLFTPFLNDGAFLQNVRSGVIGALTASVPLLLLSLMMDRLLKRESMGGGDIKLFFFAGLFFRWQEVLFLLIVSCILGILFFLITKKTVGDPENPKAFPFGPAIAAGVYLSLLTAEPFISFYLGFFSL